MISEIINFPNETERKKRLKSKKAKEIKNKLSSREGMPKELPEEVQQILQEGAEQAAKIEKLNQEEFKEEARGEQERGKVSDITRLSEGVKEKQWERWRKAQEMQEEKEKAEKWRRHKGSAFDMQMEKEIGYSEEQRKYLEEEGQGFFE